MEKESIYTAISYVLAISIWGYLTISGEKGIENFKKVFIFIGNFFKKIGEYIWKRAIILLIMIICFWFSFRKFISNFFKKQEICIIGEVVKVDKEENLMKNPYTENDVPPSRYNILIPITSYYRIDIKMNGKIYSVFLDEKNKDLYEKIRSKMQVPVYFICRKRGYWGKLIFLR